MMYLQKAKLPLTDHLKQHCIWDNSQKNLLEVPPWEPTNDGWVWDKLSSVRIDHWLTFCNKRSDKWYRHKHEDVEKHVLHRLRESFHCFIQKGAGQLRLAKPLATWYIPLRALYWTWQRNFLVIRFLLLCLPKNVMKFGPIHEKDIDKNG